jgi:allantoinase
VHFGFLGGASGDNLNQVEGMAKAGAVGFKTFRTGAMPGREDEFFGICAPDA